MVFLHLTPFNRGQNTILWTWGRKITSPHVMLCALWPDKKELSSWSRFILFMRVAARVLGGHSR